MKNNYIKVFAIIVALTASKINFSQSKQIPIQGFTSPFSSKSGVNTNVVSPQNPRSVEKKLKINITNGSFFQNVEGLKISIDDVASSFNSLLNLSNENSFKKINEKIDEFGITHISYQQYYNGISADGFMVLAHFKNGLLNSINGQCAEIKEIDLSTSISSENSIELAKAFLSVRGDLLNQYPIEKVIMKLDNENKKEYKLAYKVRIDAVNPFTMCYVYVDANTGHILNKVDLITDIDTPGTAQTFYSGAQSITMDSYSGKYRLRENTRKIETYDATNAIFTTGTGFTGQTDFFNATTSWTGLPYLASFTISSASTSWWYAALVDIKADFYIIVKDGSNQQIYKSNYITDTNVPVTFYPNILLTNPPYTVELWDYDAGNSDDYGGTYSLSTNIGTQTYSGSGNSGSYLINSFNNPALDVHWGMEKSYDFYKNVFGRNSFDGLGSRAVQSK